MGFGLVAETSKAARATVPSLTEQIVKHHWYSAKHPGCEAQTPGSAESETTSAEHQTVARSVSPLR